MFFAALDPKDAETVAWLCFFVGVIVLVTGLVLGVLASLRAVKGRADEKLKEAKDKIDETKTHIASATRPGLESSAAAGAATASAEAAKSALEQIGGIVASLPENLRFSGMLVLIGAILMSVGTIQFGGVSLF